MCISANVAADERLDDMKYRLDLVFGLLGIFLIATSCFAQVVESTNDDRPERPRSRDFFGLKVSPEVERIIAEIEQKTGSKLYADFVEQPEFQFGASFIEKDRGRAVVLIDPSLANAGKRLEAVAVHELLHLRMTVNGFPSFLWSSKVRTAKGLAIDVEQSNINDLRSIIEHRVFRSEMQRLRLYKYIDLAGDAATSAKNARNQEAGQNDTINYVRAILEYHTPKDVEDLRKVYVANGWQREIKTGTEIAAIIDGSPLSSPTQIETVFLRCILKLYPPPNATYKFKLTLDGKNKHFRRMIVDTDRIFRKRK